MARLDRSLIAGCPAFAGLGAEALDDILARFRQRRALPEKQELQNRLQAVSDHAQALELLRQLKNRTGDGEKG